MKKILACMFAFTLILTGCGSSDEEENIDPNTGKEKLVIAMDCASAPYNYSVEEQGDNTIAFDKSSYVSGYDALVARDIAKALKKEVVIKKMSADKFAEALDDGDVDMVMGGLLKDSNNEDMSYSSPYYATALTMVVRKDGKYADKDELSQFKGANVQGLSNTYYDSAIDQIKGVKHKEAGTSYEAMIKSLTAKKIDAITLNQQMAELIVKQHADLKIVTFKEKKGFKDGTGIVIGFESDSELIKSVNKALKKLTAEKQKEYMDIAVSTAPAIAR